MVDKTSHTRMTLRVREAMALLQNGRGHSVTDACKILHKTLCEDAEPPLVIGNYKRVEYTVIAHNLIASMLPRSIAAQRGEVEG